LYSAST